MIYSKPTFSHQGLGGGVRKVDDSFTENHPPRWVSEEWPQVGLPPLQWYSTLLPPAVG